METKDLYREKNQCSGCEACSIVCPKHLIKMQPDEEGFLYPKIDDSSECISCGKCLSVCPVKSPGRKPQAILESHGGYIKNTEDIKKCASGGYATAISKQFISQGGVVYGVKWSDDFMIPIYAKAATVDEVEHFRTSKYAQAHKGQIYDSILSDLRLGVKVLFIGLPCEVSALYHYVGKNVENLYTISLICHGPTSPKVHEDFCSNLENKYHSKLAFFSLRNKVKGWKPYYIRAEFENGNCYQKPFERTTYGMAFQYLKRPSCSVCRYKTKDSSFGLISDLTLGDFHSVSQNSVMYNSWGVSQASIQSEKGRYLLELISKSCVIDDIPSYTILNTNEAFHVAIPQKEKRMQFVSAYISHSLKYACYQPCVFVPYVRRQIEKNWMRFKSFLLNNCLRKLKSSKHKTL